MPAKRESAATEGFPPSKRTRGAEDSSSSSATTLSELPQAESPPVSVEGAVSHPQSDVVTKRVKQAPSAPTVTVMTVIPKLPAEGMDEEETGDCVRYRRMRTAKPISTPFVICH